MSKSPKIEESSGHVLLAVCHPLLDITYQTDAETLKKFGLKENSFCLRERGNEGHDALYKHLDDLGDKKDANGSYVLEYVAGGSTFNSLRAAEYWRKKYSPNESMDVRLYGSLGDDRYANIFQKQDELVGVNSSIVERVPGESTGIVAVLVVDQQRTMCTDPGAAWWLKPNSKTVNKLAMTSFPSPSIMFTSGYFVVNNGIAEVLQNKYVLTFNCLQNSKVFKSKIFVSLIF